MWGTWEPATWEFSCPPGASGVPGAQGPPWAGRHAHGIQNSTRLQLSWKIPGLSLALRVGYVRDFVGGRGAQKKHLPPRSGTRPPRQASLSLWMVALLLKLFLFCPDSVYPPGLGWRGDGCCWKGCQGWRFLSLCWLKRLTDHSFQRGRTLEHLWAISLLHILSRGETPHFPPKIGKPNLCFVSVCLGGSPTCWKDT